MEKLTAEDPLEQVARDRRWDISYDILERDLKMEDWRAQKFLQRIVDMMFDRYRPIFLGTIACELGLSLRKTEVLINDVLVPYDILRKASDEELKAIGIFIPNSIAYVKNK